MLLDNSIELLLQYLKRKNRRVYGRKYLLHELLEKEQYGLKNISLREYLFLFRKDVIDRYRYMPTQSLYLQMLNNLSGLMDDIYYHSNRYYCKAIER